MYLIIKKAKVDALIHIKCASPSEDLSCFKTEETLIKFEDMKIT